MFYEVAEVMLFMLAVIGWFNASYKYEREKDKRFKAYYRGYRRGFEDCKDKGVGVNE